MFGTSASATIASKSYAKACFCDNHLMSAADSLNQKENKWVGSTCWEMLNHSHTHTHTAGAAASFLTVVLGNTLGKQNPISTVRYVFLNL